MASDSIRKGAVGTATIASGFYPELLPFLDRLNCENDEQFKQLYQLLSVSDPLVQVSYPLSAKLFLQLKGMKINCNTRKKKVKLAAQDYIMFNNLLEVITNLSKENNIELFRFNWNL